MINTFFNRIVFFPGQELVVFRDTKGLAHVLDAYCPHMGANLGVGGRVVGDCIECPFHGWKFRGHDGKCMEIPYSDKGEISACLNGKNCISNLP